MPKTEQDQTILIYERHGVEEELKLVDQCQTWWMVERSDAVRVVPGGQPAVLTHKTKNTRTYWAPWAGSVSGITIYAVDVTAQVLATVKRLPTDTADVGFEKRFK